jgi:hypothetical protein
VLGRLCAEGARTRRWRGNSTRARGRVRRASRKSRAAQGRSRRRHGPPAATSARQSCAGTAVAQLDVGWRDARRCVCTPALWQPVRRSWRALAHWPPAWRSGKGRNSAGASAGRPSTATARRSEHRGPRPARLTRTGDLTVPPRGTNDLTVPRGGERHGGGSADDLAVIATLPSFGNTVPESRPMSCSSLRAWPRHPGRAPRCPADSPGRGHDEGNA